MFYSVVIHNLEYISICLADLMIFWFCGYGKIQAILVAATSAYTICAMQRTGAKAVILASGLVAMAMRIAIVWSTTICSKMHIAYTKRQAVNIDTKKYEMCCGQISKITNIAKGREFRFTQSFRTINQQHKYE